MTKQSGVNWGWGTFSDFASWAIGVAVALWQVGATGTIDPAVLTFVAGCMGFPLVRRGVESKVGDGKGQ